MQSLLIRELTPKDEEKFLTAMQQSKHLHHPWVSPPITPEGFKNFIVRTQQPNHQSYLLYDASNSIIGVYNFSEIVRGPFQNAYLGFYVVASCAGHGYMSQGLKLVLKKAFTELGLHRIEANIQPQNIASIRLIQKNGFRKEGFSPRYLFIDKKWRDHERWAITVEDWQELD